MADVIKKARPRRGARYLCLEGADDLVRYPAFSGAEASD